MKVNPLAVSILSFALATAAGAQGTAASAGNGTHYSQSQLKQMEQSARTPEQFEVLAGYFASQQKTWLQKAAEEKREWERRSQYTSSISAKYPRPVDSARNLYEYYMYKASETGTLSARYTQLGAPSSQVKNQ